MSKIGEDYKPIHTTSLDLLNPVALDRLQQFAAAVQEETLTPLDGDERTKFRSQLALDYHTNRLAEVIVHGQRLKTVTPNDRHARRLLIQVAMDAFEEEEETPHGDPPAYAAAAAAADAAWDAIVADIREGK